MSNTENFIDGTAGRITETNSIEQQLLQMLESGDESYCTGRSIVTFHAGSSKEALKYIKNAQGMRVADARDYGEEGDASMGTDGSDAVYLSEIGVALINNTAAKERGMDVASEISADSPIISIDPEHFVFNYDVADHAEAMFQQDHNNNRHTLKASWGRSAGEYLRGFLRATEMIAQDLMQADSELKDRTSIEEQIEVLGATWGLNACKVPQSKSGAGIKVAVLDSGMDLGHPDFVGRSINSQSFVGQPVQDLYGHATHMVGTACGPLAPAGLRPRYGIGYRTSIFIAKVLNNSGAGTTAGILTGMNWAIANRCQVILVPLAGSGGPIAAYTNAGQAALNNNCLIIAGSSSAMSVGAPANSPTIMSVGAVNQQLQPAAFSPSGKIDIAAPGVDIFSSYPRPQLYQTWSGLASAAAHVAGCAALWAETSPQLRGINLWRRLQAQAKRYSPFFPPYPPNHLRLGAGLVQAP